MLRIISGIYKNHRLLTPKGLKTRPTAERLREALFNICQGYLQEARVLDLCAGSGAIGLEALSRGAAFATFVDNHRDSIHCIKQNIAHLQVEKCCQVCFGDLFDWMKKLEAKGQIFDLIFADPPYGATNQIKRKETSYSQQILHMVDRGSLLAPRGMLFIEDAEETQPIDPVLAGLIPISTRRFGRALLQQWQSISLE